MGEKFIPEGASDWKAPKKEENEPAGLSLPEKNDESTGLSLPEENKPAEILPQDKSSETESLSENSDEYYKVGNEEFYHIDRSRQPVKRIGSDVMVSRDSVSHYLFDSGGALSRDQYNFYLERNNLDKDAKYIPAEIAAKILSIYERDLYFYDDPERNSRTFGDLAAEEIENQWNSTRRS